MGHQSLNVVGFDAATVEDSQARSPFGSEIRRRQLPQEPMRFRCHFWRRRATRTNRPDRFVSKDNTRELGTGQRGYASMEVPLQDLLRPACLAVGKQFPNA